MKIIWNKNYCISLLMRSGFESQVFYRQLSNDSTYFPYSLYRLEGYIFNHKL